MYFFPRSEVLRFLVSYLVIPTQKSLYLKGFCLSLYFYYTICYTIFKALSILSTLEINSFLLLSNKKSLIQAYIIAYHPSFWNNQIKFSVQTFSFSPANSCVSISLTFTSFISPIPSSCSASHTRPYHFMKSFINRNHSFPNSRSTCLLISSNKANQLSKISMEIISLS